MAPGLIEATGINSIESKLIDKLHYEGCSCAVITCYGQGDPPRCALGPPELHQVSGIDIVESLDHRPVQLLRNPSALRHTEALSQPLVPYVRKGYADYHHWLSGVLKRARRKPRLVTAVDGAISLIAAVEAGQGIGFAPSTFAVVAGRRVRFVPLSAAPPLAVGYVVRATRPNEILETFIHALHSVTRKA